IPGDLVARPGKARTRFGTFDGCGSLLSWLSVQVARRLADRAAARRTASIERGVDGSEVARRPDLTTAGSDPSDIVLGNETVAFLEDGLRSAWRELNARERDALLWRFRDGLPLQQISMHLGVSVSQASRIVSAGVETVRATVLARFRASDSARFRDGERLWSLLRDVVARHLQSPASSPDSHPCEPAPGDHAPAV
ncbi:MAG TPA: sigma factor-like helix-turn-helix DNA-binding protein, partial [Planctomycetota bacterium]|nr:sigma factor-like helix-turn-helix DNA-binding protein [Planctomycetota bacterium]